MFSRKLYLQSGQNALATKECRLVLQHDPSDQTALYHLVLGSTENQATERKSRTCSSGWRKLGKTPLKKKRSRIDTN